MSSLCFQVQANLNSKISYEHQIKIIFTGKEQFFFY
jgi:hypothetical protein